jgi:hypothetical protein
LEQRALARPGARILARRWQCPKLLGYRSWDRACARRWQAAPRRSAAEPASTCGQHASWLKTSQRAQQNIQKMLAQALTCFRRVFHSIYMNQTRRPGQSATRTWSLAPAVGPAPGLVVVQITPGVAARGVVLAHRSPLTFADVRSPKRPGRMSVTPFFQSLVFCGHRYSFCL